MTYNVRQNRYILLCHQCTLLARCAKGSIDRLGLCHPPRENFEDVGLVRPKMAPPVGLFDFQDFLGLTHAVLYTFACVYVCVWCAATCRIASTTHFATGTISRAFAALLTVLNNQSLARRSPIERQPLRMPFPFSFTCRRSRGKAVRARRVRRFASSLHRPRFSHVLLIRAAALNLRPTRIRDSPGIPVA